MFAMTPTPAAMSVSTRRSTRGGYSGRSVGKKFVGTLRVFAGNPPSNASTVRYPTRKAWTKFTGKRVYKARVKHVLPSCDQLSATATTMENNAAVDVITSTTYTPSPVDPSAFTGQIVAFLFIAIAVVYVQAVLNPTAKERFDANDPDRKQYIKELMAGEGVEGDTRQLERMYYRKVILASGLRPRGDQTKGGTIVPGIGDDVARGKGKKSKVQEEEE